MQTDNKCMLKTEWSKSIMVNARLSRRVGTSRARQRKKQPAKTRYFNGLLRDNLPVSLFYFSDLLQETPPGFRCGLVFKLNGGWTGWQVAASTAGRVVTRIG